MDRTPETKVHFDERANDFELAASRGLFLLTIEARSKDNAGERPEKQRVFANSTPKVGEIIVLQRGQRAAVTEVCHAIVQTPPLKLPLLTILVSAERIPEKAESE